MQAEIALKKLEIERFSIRTSKPFESVVDVLKASVGRLNVGELTKSSKSAGSFADLEKLIGRNMGGTGLMLFEELDHGAVLRKESGLEDLAKAVMKWEDVVAAGAASSRAPVRLHPHWATSRDGNTESRPSLRHGTQSSSGRSLLEHSSS